MKRSNDPPIPASDTVRPIDVELTGICYRNETGRWRLQLRLSGEVCDQFREGIRFVVTGAFPAPTMDVQGCVIHLEQEPLT
jgi:hypothetical protein